MRACFNARTKSVLQPKVPRPDRRERVASGDGDDHGGGRRDQNGDGGREHRDGGRPGKDTERLGGLALLAGPNRSCGRRAPGLTGASGWRQVMVMTTAAAAATRMAMAAVSTVMEVAKVVISQSRRALNAPRWGGTGGIAGRESMECPPQRIGAGNA